MLSIVTSGLNAAQKDLSVTSNNLANAGTTGFKRSEASFMDVYSSDPSSNPKTQVGGGTTLAEITRSTSQGPLKTTDNVTDLAITGRGYFRLARDDKSLVYTRAGNFTVRSDGVIVDSQDNQLQVFKVDKNGKPTTDQGTTYAVVPAEKSPGQARITLNENTAAGTQVTLKVSGAASGEPYKVTESDRIAGFVTMTSADLNLSVAQQITASFDNASPDVKGEYQQVFVQGLSIDTKGLINVNYSDGSKSPIGSVAVANFPYEAGLVPAGDTNFVESVDSGAASLSEAGAPAAGEIRSGVLEESNVDMTAELMQMLKAQQVYNGNARMMQTAVEMVSRITDKL